MNDRVVEILTYIMTEIRGQKSNPDKLELISRDLLQRGYSQHEISFAFTWLFERYRGESEEVFSISPASRGSFRVLHELEKAVIAPEAFGYLLQLKQLRLVTDVDIENIIERAMLAGVARIAAEDIKALVASVLFSPEGMRDRALIFEGNNAIH
jgi:uncharacterized protein Smg (DUF494 family)